MKRKNSWWFLPFLHCQSTTIYRQLRKRHCAPCSFVVLALFYDVFPLTLPFNQFLRAIRRRDFSSFLCFLRGNSKFGRSKGSGNRIRRFRSRARRSQGINLCVRTVVVTDEEFLESKNFEEDNGSWLRRIEKDGSKRILESWRMKNKKVGWTMNTIDWMSSLKTVHWTVLNDQSTCMADRSHRRSIECRNCLNSCARKI